MRLSYFAAGSALLLTACGNNGQTANVTNADENIAADSISSNDVTAIDAVTGDASNMAADVNYIEPQSVSNEVGSEHMPTPRTRAPGKPPIETPTPATPAPTNNAAE